MKVEQLFKEIAKLNSYHKTIMYLLLEIYEDECYYNEGSFRERDLIYIYNLIKDCERRINNENRKSKY